MKHFFITLVFASLPLVAQAETIFSWSGNGHSYEMVQQIISWTDANTAAQALSLNGQPGYLASVTSQEEQDFIYSTFVGIGAHAAWIGLTADQAYGGGGNIGLAGPGAPNWVWTSGEPTSYTNWVTNGNNSIPSPNNSGPGGVGEPYTELGFVNTDGTPGRWNDLQNANNDGNTRYYVVEFNTAVPEPSSIALLIVGGFGILFLRRKKKQ